MNKDTKIKKKGERTEGRPPHTPCFRLHTSTLAFTLIETLIGLAILSAAIVVPIRLTYKSFLSARYARDQLTAVYLAMEGIEYVRQRRDTNRLQFPDSPDRWLQGFSGCVPLAGSSEERWCELDLSAGFGSELRPCPTTSSFSSCRTLFISPQGEYAPNKPGWQPTPFRRGIRINEYTGGGSGQREARVIVDVRWRTLLLPEQKASFEERLSSW